VLLRPFSVMHDVEKCNPKMVEKLQNSSNAGAGHDSPDPRWDTLKTLKDKINKP